MDALAPLGINLTFLISQIVNFIVLLLVLRTWVGRRCAFSTVRGTALGIVGHHHVNLAVDRVVLDILRAGDLQTVDYRALQIAVVVDKHHRMVLLTVLQCVQ